MRGCNWLMGLVLLGAGWPGMVVGQDVDMEEVRRRAEKYERDAAEEAAKKAPAPKPKPAPVPKTQPQPAPRVNYDHEAWKSAEKCGTTACIEAYLEEYPKGRYAKMAKARLKPEPVSQIPGMTMVPAATPAAEQPAVLPGEAAFQKAEEVLLRGDEGRALVWCQQSAAAGNPIAKAQLAILNFEGGGGLSKSAAEAQRWAREALPELRKLATQGDPRAQYRLGWLTKAGLEVAKDDIQALAWLRKAAERGYAPAQFTLSIVYGQGAEGVGVTKDTKQAAAWLRKAAEQGLVAAQFALGMIYVTGEGVVQDDRDAVAWFRKAAEQGFAPAQTMLGIAYAEGRGVARDPYQAEAWLRKAAERGDNTAQTALARLRAGR